LYLSISLPFSGFSSLSNSSIIPKTPCSRKTISVVSNLYLWVILLGVSLWVLLWSEHPDCGNRSFFFLLLVGAARKVSTMETFLPSFCHRKSNKYPIMHE
jgi:hypothetical protein